MHLLFAWSPFPLQVVDLEKSAVRGECSLELKIHSSPFLRIFSPLLFFVSTYLPDSSVTPNPITEGQDSPHFTPKALCHAPKSKQAVIRRNTEVGSRDLGSGSGSNSH